MAGPGGSGARGVTDGLRPPDADDPVVADLLARCTFPSPDTAVVCAVSGGADSSALLALAVAAGLRVTAVHVDHGARAGSSSEAELVRVLAAAWGAEFVGRSCRVEPGADFEARARAERHRLVGAGALFGHTADDQAETIVLRLLRGTGPTGLAAMRPVTHPMLGLRRADTEALCEHLGVVAFRDPSNADPRFRRNRVRAEVMPLLDRVAERDIVPLLCRLADQSAEVADLIDVLAGELDPSVARVLATAPAPVATAAFRRWWAEVTAEQFPPDAAAIDRVMAVARGETARCDIGRGWALRRSAGRLHLESMPPRSSPEDAAR